MEIQIKKPSTKFEFHATCTIFEGLFLEKNEGLFKTLHNLRYYREENDLEITLF